MIVGFDPWHHVDGFAGVEHCLDASIDGSLKKCARLGIECTSQLNHALGVVPDLEIRGAALTIERGQATIGDHGLSGGAYESCELARWHGLRGIRQLRQVVEEGGLVLSGGTQAALESIEMRGCREPLGEQVTEHWSHFDGVGSRQERTGFTPGEARMGDQFGFGDDVGRLIVVDHVVHPRDDADLLGGQGCLGALDLVETCA